MTQKKDTDEDVKRVCVHVLETKTSDLHSGIITACREFGVVTKSDQRPLRKTAEKYISCICKPTWQQNLIVFSAFEPFSKGHLLLQVTK